MYNAVEDAVWLTSERKHTRWNTDAGFVNKGSLPYPTSRHTCWRPTTREDFAVIGANIHQVERQMGKSLGPHGAMPPRWKGEDKETVGETPKAERHAPSLDSYPFLDTLLTPTPSLEELGDPENANALIQESPASPRLPSPRPPTPPRNFH
ncbi:hypothetical protein HOLleu_26540 [Holothuria leucospilota]|uniref:Uncharacterized protein n=1 Tax=Holothuria leucospilota TaxID=206669 RepID=A0A9Q1BPD2_HOLLE|nr:hypothetical protein HOLleu_26540 [Holothuria leucospilota]